MSLLMVSPLSRGLFRRAIAESGSLFGGDVSATPPEKAAKRLRDIMSKKFPGMCSSILFDHMPAR